MNRITVIAQGQAGSFVRNVQENPALAVGLRQACRALCGQLERLELVNRKECQDAALQDVYAEAKRLIERSA